MFAEDVGASVSLKGNFHDLFNESCSQYSGHIALICRHQQPHLLHQGKDWGTTGKQHLRWTYAQLHETASKLATEWHAFGIRKGMRIVALLHSGAEWVTAFYATVLLGCAFVPLNTVVADKGDDLDHMLGLAEPAAILTWDAQMAESVQRCVNPVHLDSCKLRMIAGQAASVEAPSGWVHLDTLMRPNLEKGAFTPLTFAKPSNDDLLLVVFTSGTTSRPKGVRHTYGSWYASALSARGAARSDPRRECHILPLFHSFGVLALSSNCATGSLCCMPSATFDAGATLRAIGEESLEDLRATPTMTSALLLHPSRLTTDLSSLDCILLGASAITPSLILEVSEGLQCPKVGFGYGMSEGLPTLTIPYDELPYTYSGSAATCGKVTPGARVRICAYGSHDTLDRGQEGELHIGGPLLAAGYLGGVKGDFYQNEGASWLATGDQAIMNDQGEIFIMGRYKDLIIRGGENIAPATIESIIDTSPGIKSQVVGISDEYAGELPVAVLSRAEGAEFKPNDMHALVISKLGKIYGPAHILTLEQLGLSEFPKTATGKIQKFKLKQLVMDHIKKLEHAEESLTTGGAVRSIWLKLTGLSGSEFGLATSIPDLVDSITMMQGLSKINRTFGTSISASELMEAPTIREQVTLVRENMGRSGMVCDISFSFSSRNGPPSVADIVSAKGSEVTAQQVRAAFELASASMDLSWENDVEDVVPIWDWGQVMLQRRRAQSYNNHHLFVANGATSQALRAAIERALDYQPMLRTMAVQQDATTPVHVIVRSSPRWYDCIIAEPDNVQSAEELSEMAVNDPEWNYAASPGPLYKILIAPIADTGTSAFVGIAQHSCFDAISLSHFFEDISAELGGQQTAKLAPRVPYKLWADNYFIHRSSALAQADVAYHVERLRGLGSSGHALWPVQKAPGWFKGSSIGSADHRKHLDGKDCTGVDGVHGRGELRSLDRLRREKALSSSGILKTALALLNIHYTGADHAIFCNHQAGRDWPFQQRWIGDKLPNAMDVNGPTIEIVVNRIAVDRKESCISLLSRVEDEHKLLTKHCHAPLFEVQRQLGQVDGAGLIDNIIRRQVFNMLPNSSTNREAESPLTFLKAQSRSDHGMLWNCRMVGLQTFIVDISYDGAQLCAAEVKEIVERFCNIAEWLTEEGNLVKSVRDCPGL